MTDFRALCAALLDWAERTSAHYVAHPDVILRARAALAQPEPQGVEPTDEELMSLYGVTTSCYHGFLVEEFRQELDFARAVLARWGRPAVEPVPVPNSNSSTPEDQ